MICNSNGKPLPRLSKLSTSSTDGAAVENYIVYVEVIKLAVFDSIEIYLRLLKIWEHIPLR